MSTTTTSAEFEKATDYQFKEDDIERAKALVRKWAPSGAHEHLTRARRRVRDVVDDELLVSHDGGSHEPGR